MIISIVSFFLVLRLYPLILFLILGVKIDPISTGNPNLCKKEFIQNILHFELLQEERNLEVPKLKTYRNSHIGLEKYMKKKNYIGNKESN